MKRNLFFSPHERIETRSKAEQRWSASHARPSLAASFRCIHCGAHVVTSPLYAGVLNRNHCPYCLWSRHLDLFAAGDRLCACKAPMRPLGLTLKQSRKKYVREDGGELMLIHACIECNNLSINRIAAWVIGTAINIAAIIASYRFDFPTGYTIVLFNAFAALVVTAVFRGNGADEAQAQSLTE